MCVWAPVSAWGNWNRHALLLDCALVSVLPWRGRLPLPWLRWERWSHLSEVLEAASSLTPELFSFVPWPCWGFVVVVLVVLFFEHFYALCVPSGTVRGNGGGIGKRNWDERLGWRAWLVGEAGEELWCKQVFSGVACRTLLSTRTSPVTRKTRHCVSSKTRVNSSLCRKGRLLSLYFPPLSDVPFWNRWLKPFAFVLHEYNL